MLSLSAGLDPLRQANRIAGRLLYKSIFLSINGVPIRSARAGFVSDFSEWSGGGADADSRHVGQDRPKRVCVNRVFNFVALLAQGGEIAPPTTEQTGG